MNEPAYHRISPININGEESNRLMIVLKTRGCEYAHKTDGGCTVCGFINHADPNITGEHIIQQLDFALGAFDLSNVGQVDLLTLGSFFNDAEVAPDTRSTIIGRVAGLEQVKRVSIESRAEYVTTEKIKTVKQALGESKTLEFGIGLESADDHLRNKVIKKGLSKKAFEQTVEKVKAAGADLLTYLLIKPPGIKENEAVEDAVKSAAYVFETAHKYGVRARAAFEPVFVCENTYLETLYLQADYRLLNLWSVVEVIRRSHKLGAIFVGLSDENLSMERMPNSCPKCIQKIIHEVELFNQSQNISGIKNLDCHCKKNYLKQLKKGEI